MYYSMGYDWSREVIWRKDQTIPEPPGFADDATVAYSKSKVRSYCTLPLSVFAQAY